MLVVGARPEEGAERAEGGLGSFEGVMEIGGGPIEGGVLEVDGER